MAWSNTKQSPLRRGFRLRGQGAFLQSCLLVLLFGCGKYDSTYQSPYQPSTDASLPSIIAKTEAYFAFDGLEPGQLQDTQIYEGTEKEIQEGCSNDTIICGYFSWRYILIDDSCPYCEIVAHELGHKVSWVLHNDVDINHQRYGVKNSITGAYEYRFPFEICK